MFNSDLPIEKIDEDALNRTSFVESLAKVMLAYTVPEGFAIGMYGKWGSGKTSVINMLLEKIEELSSDSQQKLVVLRFNPWLCSDSKQLISQFFKQLSSAIRMEQSGLDKVCNFMNDYADAFDIAGAIPIAGSILSATGKILGKKAKRYIETKNSDLQSIKNEIMTTLLNERIKILVTIDDVDRLSNEEIISVFQLVKSLADFPYTIYLLAFDRDVVIRALTEVQKGDGAEYLEKIIQVPFELPAPNAEDIHQVFFTKLDSIVTITEENWDKEYWSEMFQFGIRPYLNSVRDVVRLTNTFALKYSQLKDETFLVDLIGLTCLQVFEPDIYSRLPLQKEQLCDGESYQESEKIQNAYNFITAGISDDKINNCKNILVKLFPKLSSISNRSFEFEYSRRYNHYEALSNGSISCSECFDRYFSLSLEATAIPRQQVDYLLFQANASELSEGIIIINSSKKITRLLDHINAAFESTSRIIKCEERAELILKCIILHWHILNDNDDTSFFTMPFSWRLSSLVERLLKAIHESNRYNFMRLIFCDLNVDISTILVILRDFESQHNRFTEKEDAQREPLIAFKELLELEKILIRRIIDEFESGELLNNDSAMYAIWFFEKIDEKEAKLYTDKMIDSDLSLAKFISASVGYGKAARRTVWKLWKVYKDDIKKYIDIDNAYVRIIEFVKTDEFKQLPDNKKENIAAFIISIENQQKTHELNDEIVRVDIEKKLQEISG